MLPGGLWEGETRHRSYAFQALTGHLELAIAEGAAGRGDGVAASLPARVSSILATVVAEVGGLPLTVDRADALSVADRQFLMRQLAALLGRDDVWLSADCGACRERFDVFIRQSQLPNQDGSTSYPFVELESDDGRCRLRVPNGRDQRLVAGIDDPGEARWALAERCFVEGEGFWSAPRRDERWLAAVEEALDAESPQVALTARTQCPECGADNDVALDPYLVLELAPEGLFEDVHSLASTYHWSEEQILSLPTARRRLYLELAGGGAEH
jgi:hypothetical protein